METKEQKIVRLKKEIQSARDTLGTVECDNFGYIGENLKYNLPIKIARLEQELKELENEKNKITYKCKWCNEELTVNDIYINNTGFAYCCKCDKPLCDVMIQDKSHFIIENFEKIPCSNKFKEFYREIKRNKGEQNE